MVWYPELEVCSFNCCAVHVALFHLNIKGCVFVLSRGLGFHKRQPRGPAMTRREESRAWSRRYPLWRPGFVGCQRERWRWESLERSHRQWFYISEVKAKYGWILNVGEVKEGRWVWMSLECWRGESSRANTCSHACSPFFFFSSNIYKGEKTFGMVYQHYKKKGHCWHILSWLKVICVNVAYFNEQLWHIQLV